MADTKSGNTTQAKAPKAESKPRKTRTTAERIAALEAELAATKAKAEERAQKTTAVLREKRSKLVARRDKLNADIEALDKQIGDTPATENVASV